ncbi:MAG TPA: DUF3501 family protein [Acidimicrobiales bacterium]|jgi:hypothetical protein|nr:DUF3501 family protein [Acidimicrobiales bacterium]
MSGRPLALDDIADARAYERERESFRTSIIELKKRRRIGVGPVISVVFENRDTIRFQIQEMARAERLLSDAAIQTELDTYNPLIPGPGELSASMYIELTNREEMEHWLPRLVGIERAVQIIVGASVVPCIVDESHAAHLTREEITAAVHFVRFELTPGQIESFRSEPVFVAIDHPAYQERTELLPASRDSLLADLLG